MIDKTLPYPVAAVVSAVETTYATASNASDFNRLRNIFHGAMLASECGSESCEMFELLREVCALRAENCLGLIEL